eukprot:GFYU01041409.1.p2 GENE.GFYU01041409.1~~GFYU01041409.1.p2  ORF type:complete len:100 (-),score=46.15 GFYU01041409.1:51-314(-)
MSQLEIQEKIGEIFRNMKTDLRKLDDYQTEFIQAEMAYEDQRKDPTYLLGKFIEKKEMEEMEEMKSLSIGGMTFDYSDMMRDKSVKF